jgi:hypothetical protein
MENKSQVAGILSIVSGVFGLLGAGSMVLVIRLVQAALEMDPTFPYEFQGILSLMYGTFGVVLALLGVLGIVGGVYAIQKKYWGLGLAGAIAGIFTFFPCGIAAIVIIALAKPEFNSAASVPHIVQPPPQQ